MPMAPTTVLDVCSGTDARVQDGTGVSVIHTSLTVVEAVDRCRPPCSRVNAA
jgi:hypothetical protein